MGLRILHTADWHLDSPLRSLPEEAAASVRASLDRLPRLIAEVCRREACDMMLLAGDIFDNPQPARSTVETLKSALAQCGVPVFISPGNHDYCSSDSPWLTEHWPKNVHIFTGSLSYTDVEALNCRVYGAGYQSMDSAPLLENFRAEGSEKYCIAVLHGDPTRKDSPYCPITAQQVRDSGLQYLALGHIHKAGAFHAGGTLCAWPGCPMGRGWDETGEKGVCIVTVEDSASLRAVALDTIRFHELKADISSGAEAALETILPPAGSRDFFRVTLTGSGEADIAKLTRRFSAVPNLTLRDETLPPLDIWGDTGADTLEGVYFRLLREAMEADPDSREEIQLAAEISRKLLEGREVTL